MADAGSIYFRIFAKTGALVRDMKKANASIRSFDTSVQRMGSSVLNLQNAFAALGIGLVVKSLWDAQVVVDQMNRAFGAITGSVEGAKEELKYIRNVADSLGGEFYALTESMKYVAAAAKDTSLEGAGVRDIFRAVTEAGVALGLTNVQVKMSLYAISQMISKGTVNAEELRQQLGERLPGAYQAMARALGVTTAQLNKMLEQGQVIATQAIPKLAKELHRMYADAAMLARNSPIGMLNRFKTAWMDLKVEMGSGDFLAAASRTLGNFTALLKDQEFKDSLTNLVERLSQLGDSAIQNAIPFINGVTQSIDKLAEALGNKNLMELAKLAAVFKLFGAKGTGVYTIAKATEYLQNFNTHMLPKDEFERLNRAKKELEEILALQEKANRTSLLGRNSPERLQRIQNTKNEIKTIEDKIAMLKREKEVEASTFYDPRGRHDPKNQLADAQALKAKLAINEKIAKQDEAAMKKKRKEEEYLVQQFSIQTALAEKLSKEKMDFDKDIKNQIEAQNRQFKALEHEEHLERMKAREELLTYDMKLEGEQRNRDYQNTLDVMKEEHNAWADTVKNLSINTFDKIEDSFSSVFKDAFRGELDSFADYFESFGYALLDTWADITGQMVAEGMLGKRGSTDGSGLFGWITNMLGGAVAGYGGGDTSSPVMSTDSHGASYDLSFVNSQLSNLSRGGANIVINEAANTPDQGTTVDRQNMDGMETVVVNLVAKNMQPGKPLGKTLKSTYGLTQGLRRS